MSAQPAQRGARTYLRILSYLLPYKGRFALVLLCNAFFVVFNTISIWMVAPFLTTLFTPERTETVAEAAPAMPDVGFLNLNAWLKQHYARWIAQPDPADALQIICAVIFATFLLKNLFQFTEAYLISYVEQRVIKDLRDQLFRSLIAKPLRFFDRFVTGNLISRITNDINELNVAVNRSFTKVIRDPIVILTFLLILVSISWRLTLFAGLVFPVSALAIHTIGRSLKRKSLRAQARIADVTSRLQETLSGVRVVQAFSQEEFEAERFSHTTWRHFHAILRQVRMRRLSSPLSETLGVGILIAVLWYGGQQVLDEARLSPEDFVRFLTVLFAILQPIKSLADLNNNIQIAVASGQRVFEVLDDPEEVPVKPNAIEKRVVEEAIEYESVGFRYNADGAWVLDDLSFRVARREKVALVGGSGAGKTTIVNLLPRFYDPERGSIRIDGIDIRDLDLQSLRRMIGIVSQDVVLFNDTIAHNIAYGCQDTPRERIVEAARLANALEFIAALPDGFDTHVGERGLRLSGGERQRLSIARAVLHNPPILIFDEATSALDSESERLVQEAIERLLEERTVFMIAHRLSSILNADRILVIEDGRLIDAGPHAELLERSPRYRHYYELQFQTPGGDA